ncbi:MAG: hypothetical protein ABMA64_28550 [Myxococcota bacterium]
MNVERTADDALPLLLLRDELSVDRAAADATSAADLLLPLCALTTLGFGVHAACVAGTAWPVTGAGPALREGLAWWAACTGGFFAAICAGLPSYWFYGVVAKVRAPAWRLAVELVRVQAVGAVILAGVVPFWLAGALGLHLVFGVEVYDSPVWMALTRALPFLCATPGVLGAYRVFGRMRAAQGHADRLPAAALTAWWMVLFLFTAPVSIHALFVALT